jgi:tRNA pseudouridine55 synthase
MDFNAGQLILINKPLGVTSFSVVKKVRWVTKAGKVGHAGTLDPLASGLLVICTGKFTKKIDQYQGLEKEYRGSMILGATTPSHDLETEINERFDISGITEQMIKEATAAFIGDVQQTPPNYSAVKVNGKRSYDMARGGEDFVLQPKTVSITAFEITAIDLPRIDFRVVCSKGTYIRSLVYDFGRALKSGAYMSALVRTRIGDLRLEDAWEMNEFVLFVKNLKSEISHEGLPGTGTI